jgi:hypothetical protein
MREKLLPLGSPRHDSIPLGADGQQRKQLLLALGLADRPTFVFFSNGNDLVRNGSAPLECADWLESVAARHSGALNVVVRLHPNEDGSLYQKCPHLRVTKGRPTLDVMLGGCDWAASLCSTVLYDAVLYKKPIFQPQADGWPELADNWKCGLATRISSESALNDIVCRSPAKSSDPVEFEHRVQRVFSNHRRAAKAIADLVQMRL